MKKFFFKKAIFSASVLSLAATMVFAIPAFAGPDFDYQSGTNYRYPSQRDYSQGSTSPFRHYQPDFNRSEQDSRFGASEFPGTSRGNGENPGADRDFGRADGRSYSEGSIYQGDTGYRGYYGDNPETRDYDKYYQGRYGRPSSSNYRENMEGRGGRQPEPRYGQSRQQEEVGETGQEMFDRSRRRQQFGGSGQQQYGQSDRRQFGDSGQQQYGQSDRRQFGDSGQQQYGQYSRQQYRESDREQFGQGQYGQDRGRRRESARRGGQQDQRFSTGMDRDRFERGYYQQRRDRQSRQQMRRGDRIQGSIKEMKTISLSKMEEDHVIARIQTREGQVAKVDLGPEQKLSDLNLKKGDQVTVHGITGSINQKPVLMAHGVEAKGQRVSIKRPQDMKLKSYSGQIMKTKKTDLREGTPTVLMARIRMDDGNTTMVNLGPEKELRNQLDIQEGKRFSMLARPAKVEGRTGLVAEFIKIGDNSVDVDWQKAKKSSR
ncbi:MAG: hypothetical protein ACOC0H_03240 [Thermodesulfobacteriota bacterium]